MVLDYPFLGLWDGVKHLKNTSMRHQFSLKEIALQSGLSLATVDRALHGRAYVSAQSARRVQTAMAELAQQEGQLAARGRRMFVDIVVEAPRRFSDELRPCRAPRLASVQPGGDPASDITSQRILIPPKPLRTYGAHRPAVAAKASF